MCMCRYIFLLGMLMSQFTITGFDACGGAHKLLDLVAPLWHHAWRLLWKGKRTAWHARRSHVRGDPER